LASFNVGFQLKRGRKLEAVAEVREVEKWALDGFGIAVAEGGHASEHWQHALDTATAKCGRRTTLE